jgi:ribosomal protein S20
LAHSSRTWTGARTPQALKRVRQSNRRNAILQPRRTAAKTQVKNALIAAEGGDVEATRKAVAEAAAALDRAAKVGAIHPNNAARRKSRLMRRANAALGGESLVVAKPQRQVSKAAAAKAAKARIAAGKASKAKGEQTAAGKARAALSKSARSSDAKETTAKATSADTAATKSTTATKPAARKTTAKKTTAKKTTATRKTTAKAKSTTKKTTAKKATKQD